MSAARAQCMSRLSAFRIFTFVLAVSITNLVTGCGGSGSGSGSTNTGGTGTTTTTPTPSLSSISPAKVNAGSSALTLTVTGSGFSSSSVVNVGGTFESTTFVSATQLTAVVPASQIAVGGNLAVTVSTGALSSSGVTLEVDNSVPVITATAPTYVLVGTSSLYVTLTGTGFLPTTVVNVNGGARTTSYTSATQLVVALTSADVSAAGTLSLTAVSPGPGGGTSTGVNLPVTVTVPTATPVIQSMSPLTFVAGSPDTTILVQGLNFTPTSTVLWNGAALTGYATSIGGRVAFYATVPAAKLTTPGSASLTVNSPSATPSLSNAITVTITNPPAPTISSISPQSGPINTDQTISVYGSGFTSKSKVTAGGVAVQTTFVSSGTLTAIIPATAVSLPGSLSIGVTTPAPGGGSSGTIPFTTYLNLISKDLVYNATDGLLYASVPATAVGIGNTVVGIDPLTGGVKKTIWVGSKPGKLALSTDGTQLFVGLDGAGAVAQVNLTSDTVVNQFSLGGGGNYNGPNTALYLAAVPGLPNSVAVAISSSAAIAIYDSGVARAKTSTGVGAGSLSFGASSSILYLLDGSYIRQLTVDSTGIAATSVLTTLSSYFYQTGSIQYDNGRLYLSNGQVVNTANGSIAGTFYVSTNTTASGPVVSDSALGRAFVAVMNYSGNGYPIMAFDETSFNTIGSMTPLNSGGYQKIVRWGQNGLALSASSNSPYGNQIYIYQLAMVKDLSPTPADLAVTLTAPATSTTGTPLSFTANVTNNGPNQALGSTMTLNLDSTMIVNSVTPSQGSCAMVPAVVCDLGTLANGTTTTVTISATPTTAGTMSGTAAMVSTSVDPTTTNNSGTATTTATGTLYSPVPALTSMSPTLVLAGSTDTALTVTGSNFNAQSTVMLGSTALTTTFVNANQLIATVPAASLANFGWAAISVSNSSPGGGNSQKLPLTIYVVAKVPASNLLFDPYGQLIYATIPSSATGITGNSVVTVDPTTATVGTPVAIGSQPNVMAETSDGKYLYVGLSGSYSLAQFDLASQSLQATIPLNVLSSPVTATSLSALPGSDTTLGVGYSGWGQVGVLDISGSTGTFRTNTSNYYSSYNPLFADATHLYAYSNGSSTGALTRYTVDANGLTQIDSTQLNGISGAAGSAQLYNGLIYGGSGGIVNPSTTPPSQVATLPIFDWNSQYSYSTPQFMGAVPDPSLQKEFMILQSYSSSTSPFGLIRYDLATYQAEGLLTLPGSSNSSTQWTPIRWGRDGLAVLSTVTSYSSYPYTTTTSIILLRGAFVVPQLLKTDSAASLTSSSSSTIAHGTGNTMLTLTGANFKPGVAVTWNGSYRTTTVVDSTHVTVAIPVSDLSSAGTAALVATNPGAGGSNALQITIN